MSREREREIFQTVPVRRLPRRRLRERHKDCSKLTQEVEGGYVPDCSPSPFSPASHMSGRGKSEKGLV